METNKEIVALKAQVEKLNLENENYKIQFQKTYGVRERLAKQTEKVTVASHNSTSFVSVKDLSYIGSISELEYCFSELQKARHISVVSGGTFENDDGALEPVVNYRITETGRKYALEIIDTEES